MSSDDEKPEEVTPEANDDQPLVELVDALENVDEAAPDAEENATTISDNNGGRIELDPKLEHQPVPSTQSVLNQDEVIRIVLKHKAIDTPERIRLVKKPKSQD